MAVSPVRRDNSAPAGPLLETHLADAAVGPALFEHANAALLGRRPGRLGSKMITRPARPEHIRRHPQHDGHKPAHASFRPPWLVTWRPW